MSEFHRGSIRYACFYDGWHFFDENKEQVFYPEDWPDHLEFAKPETLEEMGIEIVSAKEIVNNNSK